MLPVPACLSGVTSWGGTVDTEIELSKVPVSLQKARDILHSFACFTYCQLRLFTILISAFLVHTTSFFPQSFSDTKWGLSWTGIQNSASTYDWVNCVLCPTWTWLGELHFMPNLNMIGWTVFYAQPDICGWLTESLVSTCDFMNCVLCSAWPLWLTGIKILSN